MYHSNSAPLPVPQPLTEEQMKNLLALSAESPTTQDLHDVVKIVLNTGMRAGELCELRFADVDHNNRQLVFNATKSCTRRVVPVGPETLQILESRRELQPELEFVLGKCPRGVVKRVERQLRTLKGMSRVSLHMLRRAFYLRPGLQNEQK